MKLIPDYFISIVIPIMNEQGNIPVLIKRLLQSLSEEQHYEIIFIDDGSTDNTLDVIKQLNQSDPRIKYLSFSRNFGHQNALRAGLDFAKGDCIISMDGDLQHPPELIPKMIYKWRENYDIVYTLRKDIKETSYFKRKTSSLFYSLMNKLSHVEIEKGSADFRLINRAVADEVCKFQENPIFYRGIIRWLGFRQFAMEYTPEQRTWGKTKYSFWKMFKFAITGITSFSIRPLHLSTILGSIIATLSIFYGIYAIILKLFTSSTIQGWTSLLIIVAFIGGIQLLMIGILGEYLGKLFLESKKRPSYIVHEKSANL